MEAFFRRDDGGGAVFGDDGGTLAFFAGLQLLSRVELRFLFSAVEEDWGFGCGKPAEPCSVRTADGSRPHMLSLQDRAKAEGDQFDFAGGVGVAVAAVVFLLEIAEEILREGEVEFVPLTAVAEVNSAKVFGSTVPGFIPKGLGRGPFEG